jgi:riboflavin synthase
LFTGIITAVGEIESMQARGGDVRVVIACPQLRPDRFAEGESICVSGVCLTALDITAESFAADVSRETLTVTALSRWAPGHRVNLEPSLAVGDRLGGHLVTGHVDGVGELRSRHDDARSVRMTVGVPAGIARYIARKGSVAVDGTSLTVNAAAGDSFDVNIIPHTASSTTLGTLAAGDPVNIEVDLMARYAERLLTADRADGGGIDIEFLRKNGYAE